MRCWDCSLGPASSDLRFLELVGPVELWVSTACPARLLRKRLRELLPELALLRAKQSRAEIYTERFVRKNGRRFSQ